MTSQMTVRSMVKNVASNFSPACVYGAVIPGPIARRRPVMRAVVMAAFLGAAGIGQVAAQTATDTEPSRTSGAPVIRGKPKQVTPTGDSGSTEIHRDTAHGSVGFAFV